MAKDPLDIQLKAGMPVYRQITEILRDKIQEGHLVPGTRLPPIGKLAKKWDTNYYTVQTAIATLAKEGLIESTTRAGSFVRRSKIQCTSVGIYFGANFHRSNEDNFYNTLFGILCERLTELNIRPHFWIDQRPESNMRPPLPTLLKAIQKREVQGVIASMVTGIEIEWLKALNVPVAIATILDEPTAVSVDLRQMVAVSLRRLRELNCKTVGLITCDASLLPLFQDEAKKLKLTTSKSWNMALEIVEATEISGARLFKQLWFQEIRPEGLLVFPDVMARGVMISIFENRVRIPEDMRVIFHLNAEAGFYCPLGVEWIVSHIGRIADELITSIRNQVSGDKPRRTLVPMELRSMTALSQL